MSLPFPPQAPANITVFEPSLGPSFAATRPESHMSSSAASAVQSRPVTSILPVTSLPVIFTPEDLARDRESATSPENDETSDDSSGDEESAPASASNSMSSFSASAASSNNDPVKLSDPFYSAKSLAGYEEAIYSAEKVLQSFDKLSALHSGHTGDKRDAVLKQVDTLRLSMEKARDGFSVCYDRDLDGADEEDDIGIFSLMHYSGKIGDSIIFSCSGVESANLQAAMRVKANNYFVKLAFDLGDPSVHNGWFCFSMRNLAPSREYCLCIINLTDNTFTRNHLGSHQFKMQGYSSRLRRWKQVDAITVLEEGFAVQPAAGPGSKYLKLTMTFRFTESWVMDSDDSVTLAAAVPYSHRELASLVGYARMHQEFCAVSSLCRTHSGNDLVAFTITAPAPPAVAARRRTLLFCARARACVDVASSWVAHGMVTFLCAGSADARALLQQFVFVIIPVMNADGVAAGHSQLTVGQARGVHACSLWNSWARTNRAKPLEVQAIQLFVRRSMDAPAAASGGAGGAGGGDKTSTRPRPPPLLFCELATACGRGGVEFMGVRNGVMSSAFYLRERTFPLAWVTSAAAAAPGAWLQPSDISFPIITEVKRTTSLHYMWSTGVANACAISIPSLGFDEQHFAVAAAAAAASRGLSQKKVEKGIGLMSKGDKKHLGEFAKGPAPFSIVQFKEIGVSLAKNCGSLLSWSEEKVPVRTGASDDPVAVQFPPSPILAAALGHLLLPAPPISSSPKKVIHSVSPRISALPTDTSQPQGHQNVPSTTVLQSPRLKRLNFVDSNDAEAGKRWMNASGAGSATRQQQPFAGAVAHALHPEELPSTPKSPSDSAAAPVTADAKHPPSGSASATNTSASDIKSQLISGGFIAHLSLPIFSHDFNRLPPPTLPSPRGPVWSLPPPSLRRFNRRTGSDDGVVVVEQRLTASPRTINEAEMRGEGQVFVVSDDGFDEDGHGRRVAAERFEVLSSDVFDDHPPLRLGPISIQQQQHEQQQQHQPPHRPHPKCAIHIHSPRMKHQFQKPQISSVAAASTTTHIASIPAQSANPVVHLFRQTLNFSDPGSVQSIACSRISALPPSTKHAAGSAKHSPRRGNHVASEPHSTPLNSNSAPLVCSQLETGKSATEYATFSNLVKLEQKYRRRLQRLLVDAAPPLTPSPDSDALPSPLLLRPHIRQDQLGSLVKASQLQNLEAQAQQEQEQQPPVQHKIELQFEGPTQKISPSMKSQIKRRRRHLHQQRQNDRERPNPATSSPRSPSFTHRQHVVDALLSVAMASIKQPPPLSISTLVQGGPGGFRSPRRQQLANVLDTGSRPASFASLSSAGNAIKLGFTSTTNTTSAITRALVSGFETVSEDAGDDQDWLWPPLSSIPASPSNLSNLQPHAPAPSMPRSPAKWSRDSFHDRVSSHCAK